MPLPLVTSLSPRPSIFEETVRLLIRGWNFLFFFNPTPGQSTVFWEVSFTTTRHLKVNQLVHFPPVGTLETCIHFSLLIWVFLSFKQCSQLVQYQIHRHVQNLSIKFLSLFTPLFPNKNLRSTVIYLMNNCFKSDSCESFFRCTSIILQHQLSVKKLPW